MTVTLAPDAPIRMIPQRKLRKWFEVFIDYDVALLYVREEAAVIKNENTIVKIYDKKTLRRFILDRDGDTCRYCGDYGDTIDHVVPRSKGGLSSPANCVCACNSCNQRKASRDLNEFVCILPKGVAV